MVQIVFDSGDTFGGGVDAGWSTNPRQQAFGERVVAVNAGASNSRWKWMPGSV